MFSRFLTSASSSVGLIYGPPQLGKTEMSSRLVRESFRRRKMVLFSCDNKTDQLKQTLNRYTGFFAGNDEVVLLTAEKDLAALTRACITAIEEAKYIVVFFLDNHSQIDKILGLVRGLIGEAAIPRLEGDMPFNVPGITLIHDEGDVITKHPNILTPEESQPVSHRQWIRLTQSLSAWPLQPWKRVFVTATPENIRFNYPDLTLFAVPMHANYVSFGDIRFFRTEDKGESFDILRRQYRRVLASGEYQAILYCTERRIAPKNDDERSQEITYDRLCPAFPEAVISTYNGEGIMTRIRNPRFQVVFNEVSQGKNPKPKAEQMDGGHWQINNLPISDFYEVCRRLESKVVITITYDLAKRGISFVSSGKVEKPLAATTMIAYPGATQNAVAGIQVLGRISGTARPDLPRFLFAPQRVFDNVRKEYENQAFMLKEKGDARKLLLPAKLSTDMDRKCLKMNPKYAPQPKASKETKATKGAKKESTSIEVDFPSDG